MVMELIMKKFGMTCNSHTLKRAMRRMGFSYSKPRPIPDKSASEEEQEKFKQETADMIRAAGRQGYVVRVCDEAAVQIWSDAKYGWRRAGGRDTVRIGFSKKSAKLIGSLGSDGYRIRAIDAINSETFIEFLQDLLKTYPKLILVMDNASCHRSKMVTEFVESTGGAIRLGVPAPVHPAAEPHRDAVGRTQAAALRQVLPIRREAQRNRSVPGRKRRDETRQVDVLPDSVTPCVVGEAAHDGSRCRVF